MRDRVRNTDTHRKEWGEKKNIKAEKRLRKGSEIKVRARCR